MQTEFCIRMCIKLFSKFCTKFSITFCIKFCNEFCIKFVIKFLIMFCIKFCLIVFSRKLFTRLFLVIHPFTILLIKKYFYVNNSRGGQCKYLFKKIGTNLEVGAWSKKGFIAKSPRVEITAILVAQTVVSEIKNPHRYQGNMSSLL